MCHWEVVMPQASQLSLLCLTREHIYDWNMMERKVCVKEPKSAKLNVSFVPEWSATHPGLRVSPFTQILQIVL